jgi:hypothetical protein
MVDTPPEIPRAFKTAWFAKAAKNALIKDAELCEAFAEIRKGLCDDLGGGVYKKRIDKNRHRSIVLAKGGLHWIYQYLFAKKDRDNIDEKELEGFRKLAKEYEALTPTRLSRLLEAKDLTEICHVDEAKIQK